MYPIKTGRHLSFSLTPRRTWPRRI